MSRHEKKSILTIKGLGLSNGVGYDLTVETGQLIIITGESGAGKSVLLKMIADLIPNTGTVSLNGQSRQSIAASRWRQKITYIAAETGWWADHVKDHMRDIAFITPFLGRLNLHEFMLDARVSQLSTGEKQRMGILRALSPDVEFLLLDEVTSALDPKSVLRVEALIRELKSEGIGIIMVSHNMDQVRRLADMHYHLTDGQLTIQNLTDRY